MLAANANLPLGASEAPSSGLGSAGHAQPGRSSLDLAGARPDHRGRSERPPLWEDRIILVHTKETFPKAAARDPSAVVVNLARREIFRGPAYIKLSPMLFAYAVLLITSHKALSVEDVFMGLWGDDEDGGPETFPKIVDVMRHKLRKVLPLVGIGIELPRYGLSQAVSLARAA